MVLQQALETPAQYTHALYVGSPISEKPVIPVTAVMSKPQHTASTDGNVVVTHKELAPAEAQARIGNRA